ncbi:MAG: endonuclease/exonuclease/phosphatase family protein [Phenylobacterium sp.]|uniref:endonuclease/exonuclease/phosphatase family protein n=1 Tax=Phenylobacterium sp. TaxID=1871053 RepID=UPI00271D9A9E|nr:endonuclease/exonuclease/phosphatase family protein [Phenylobacterium sp.]MDO8900930.1 endonuclease/exonuclease/phosphatase family protein [Phenylobacterium sp.]
MGLVRVVITRILEDIAAALAVGSALAMLAAQGGRFSDRLDIATHFALVFLVLAMVAALMAALTPRSLLRRVTLGAAALAVALAGVLILPEMVRNTQPASDSEGAELARLKVIQMNTWSGRNQTMDETADWLVAQDPDIIVVEESSRRFQRALEARGDYHRTCDPDDRCEVIIYSKAAPVSGGLPRVSDGAYFPATRATFDAPGGDFTVIGAHFTWPVPAGPQQQQSLRLTRIAELYDRDRLIITGDFNATPWSFTLRRQDKALGLTRRNRAMLTWPAMAFSRWNIHMPLPFLAIDHVYAGSDWKTVSVERGPSLGSDHFPVIVTLALSPAD